MRGTVHIIGAGLAGLSAATRLVQKGRRVVVYEAASQAGGRCRSYYDPAFGSVIDNGNHLLLSGNEAALSYLKRISAPALDSKKEPMFDFVDAHTMQRWSLRLNTGRLPLWLFNKTRRVPGTGPTDYLSILRLLRAKPQQTVSQLLDTGTLLYKRLWHSLLISALNTDSAQSSAQLAAAVIRGTLLKGGAACVPIVAEGLSALFIDPALSYLAANKAEVMLNHRAKQLHLQNGNATRLEFAAGEPVLLATSDTVICAASCASTAALLPGLEVPDDYRAILNVHFRIAPPPSFPKIMGVVNATTEWIFAFPDRISVTVSAADRLMHEEREVLAQRIWQEVAAITGLAATLPPWQIVKEKRATFAATPEQDAKRPVAETMWQNVYLAGDYVQTGLPATIEGAIRSGLQTAELIMRRT
jgi:squalene-associated FAD-dependent desaturase